MKTTKMVIEIDLENDSMQCNSRGMELARIFIRLADLCAHDIMPSKKIFDVYGNHIVTCQYISNEV